MGSGNRGVAYAFYRKGAPYVYIRRARYQPTSTGVLPIEWDVEFSKPIAPGSFSTADIDMDGAASASGVTWNLINSGDDRHYTLQATAVASAGTIIPELATNSVFDPFWIWETGPLRPISTLQSPIAPPVYLLD